MATPLNKGTRTILLVITLIAIGVAIGYLDSLKATPRASAPQKNDVIIPVSQDTSVAVDAQIPNNAPSSTRAEQFAPIARLQIPDITNPSGFINSQPFTLGKFVGDKVVLVDFWTYSCINCQRTLPYVTAWDTKYRDYGLQIIGVHTPEFSFEKKYDNVVAATKKFGIEYPVVLDNDYGTWSAYQNLYWPRKYIIDIHGKIVYDHIGEGSYDVTERKIQELLTARMKKIGGSLTIPGGLVTPSVESAPDPSRPTSPEVYFGAARNEFLGNGTPRAEGLFTFISPDTAEPNVLYFGGTWNMAREYAETAEAGAKIIYRYRGRAVHFVAGAAKGVRVTVLRDGKPLGVEAGSDVVRDGEATSVLIKDERLYNLIRDDAWGEHTLELIFDSPELEAFTFTFG
ncbi:MAG: redoxin family protein [Patescibacteria group bacterium]|nr:redoxin family protein [Patescibacteria group bacterium]